MLTNLFAEHGEDQDDFFDITHCVQTPNCQMEFQNMRVLQTICLLPNMHLLVEGGIMDCNVEVYELTAGGGQLSEPTHVIQTNARGLNAIEYDSAKIYLGFMGTMSDSTNFIQIYDYDYQLLT